MRPRLTTALAAGVDALSRLTRSDNYRNVAHYERCRSLPIAEKTVLFEAYHGARMSCNPYAIFKQMLEDPEFADHRFVWTLDEQDPNNRIFAQYRQAPRVEFHARHTPGYLKHLATAKYLVNNKTFYQYFAKRPEQIYISTWHGTTLKTLGKDQYGTMGQYHNVARNILQTDYLVMPNRFTADVLLDSCDVRSLFAGVVVDAGQPRSDLTLNTDSNQVKQTLAGLLGIDPSKRLVLYAPTWRGEVGGSRDISHRILENIEGLLAGLPDGFELLLKVHDKTYVFVQQNAALETLANVPDWFETNELLAGIDVLVTDYSSIFFDFLCLRRPVIHYVFDREEYERTRGLYFDMETEMAGPLCTTADEVNAALARIDEVAQEYQDRHESLLGRFSYHEDGHASQRVLDAVFGGLEAEYTYRTEEKSRPRVVAYAGRLNAATEPLLRALSGLDLTAIDLVLLFDGAPNKRDEYYLTKLDPRIKVFYRVASSVRWEELCSAVGAKTGSEAALGAPAAAQAWREEFLGAVEFDVAIDFAGQESAWQLMFAHTPFKRRIAFVAPQWTDSPASLKSLARHFDELVCTAVEVYDSLREQFEGSKVADKLVMCEVPAGFDEFVDGVAADVAHVVAGIDYCVECEARSVDPYCETGDLLFEFRVGGLEPLDLSVHPELESAVVGVHEVLAAELSQAADVAGTSTAGASRHAVAACDFARLFSADGGGS